MTTKERILQTAITLFAQKGYTETSLKEIAQGCGIQAASIYCHFRSKSEILESILTEYIDYTRANTPTNEMIALKAKTEPPKELMMSMFYRYAPDTAVKYAGILKIILHEHLRNERIGEFFENYFMKDNENRLDYLLVQLIENKRINPINHRYYAKILNNLTLSMALEFSHYITTESHIGEDYILMDDLILFVIDLILKDDGTEDSSIENNQRQWIKQGVSRR